MDSDRRERDCGSTAITAQALCGTRISEDVTMAQDIVRLPGDESDGGPEQQPAAVAKGAAGPQAGEPRQAGEPAEAGASAEATETAERSAAGVLSGLGFGGSGAKPGDAPDGDTPG